MEVKIRIANISDVDSILKVTKLAFNKYAKDLGKSDKVVALKEDRSVIIKDLESKVVIVAEKDGEILGSIRLEINKEHGYITRFGVDPRASNLGIGKMILSYVKEYAKSKDLKVLSLHTAAKMTSVACFYYRNGFYIDSTSNDKGYIRALFVQYLDED